MMLPKFIIFLTEMEGHKKHLQTLCRICGNKRVLTHDKNSKLCTVALLSVFDIDVREESGLFFPPLICHCCDSTVMQLHRAQEEKHFRETSLVPQTWIPHSDCCQLCDNASEPLRGRPKKRKAQGRSSDDDTHYHNRKLLHHPTYRDSKLHPSRFLKSPHLDHLTCKICSSIPNQPLQILSCGHLLCLSCTEHLLNQNETALACPCSNTVISMTELGVPSQLSLQILESLMLSCDRGCGQILELQHLRRHINSKCTDTPIPPPAKITVEQLLDMGSTSRLQMHTMGLVAEKIIPSNGPVTLCSSTGKVINAT